MKSRKMNDGFFFITRLHRDDLSILGFDGSSVDDETMERICKRMNESIMSEIYWKSLESAAKALGIPRTEDEEYYEDED